MISVSASLAKTPHQESESRTSANGPVVDRAAAEESVVDRVGADGTAIQASTHQATTAAVNEARAFSWCYEQAFCRNLGLIDPQEQRRLRDCHVAVAGLGGVGGVQLMTLARLGVHAPYIRHPSHGGKTLFTRGVQALPRIEG